jgi:hypothetical protein
MYFQNSDVSTLFINLNTNLKILLKMFQQIKS